jgi:hypothetical protein
MSIDLMPGFGAFTPASGAAGTTWSTSDYSGSVAFSNGDLTVTKSGGGEARGRATLSRSTGKYHFEGVCDTGGNPVGLGLSLSSFSTYFGDGTSSVGYYGQNGEVAFNSTALATISTYTSGDVLAVEVDLDGDLIWFAKNAGDWNNNGSADPATGTGGLSYAAMSAGALFPTWYMAAASAVFTLRVTSAAFTRAVSSGFSEWG